MTNTGIKSETKVEFDFSKLPLSLTDMVASCNFSE